VVEVPVELQFQDQLELVDKVIVVVVLDQVGQMDQVKVAAGAPGELVVTTVVIEEELVEQVYYTVSLVLMVPIVLIVIQLRLVKDILHLVDLEEE
jgi:hypothetical protein